jgi:hypothetical protein
MECLKFDVNLMVCFDIDECKNFLYDLASKWIFLRIRYPF